ncbi:MAG: BatA domain-containing protein [Flavobacteriaceae bacterium]|nr:BatA domain-containing protein [Flavobacteriaceae bacterium]MDG1963091.1 BatA domain-containing protein [Flavobacteriaceae bacterium]
MTFFRPEFLKALFLLVIPIIIHLFEFRKFIPTRFTNVVFLKQLQQESRQSARLKKWLLLALRLAYFSALILAFARPVLLSDTVQNSNTTLIYLNNNLSMETRGASGMSLLKQSTQELYSSITKSNLTQVSWFTNDHTYFNMPIERFKSTILNTRATHRRLDQKAVMLKTASYFQSYPSELNQLIYISDFYGAQNLSRDTTGIPTQYILRKPAINNNLSIDTAYVDHSNPDKWAIKTQVSGGKPDQEPVMLRLMKDSLLLAQAALNFDRSGRAFAFFERSEKEAFQGTLTLKDQGIPFDNILYFTHTIPQPINILVLEGLESDKVSRVFGPKGFVYTSQKEFSLDFSAFSQQDFIIINGLKTISPALLTALDNFKAQGGHLLLVPHPQANSMAYQDFFNRFDLGTLEEQKLPQKKLTNIEKKHPLFNNIFEKDFDSFQYPTILNCLALNTKAMSLLALEDNHPYLINNESVYAFLGSLTPQGGNFTQSPLFVATLIEMARQSAPEVATYYTLGVPSKVDLNAQTTNDQVVTLSRQEDYFIPRQTYKQDQITLFFDQEPNEPGHFKATYQDQQIGSISFNAPRARSLNVETNSPTHDPEMVATSIPEVFSKLQQYQENQELWKWFVIFALACLVTELLIIKLR